MCSFRRIGGDQYERVDVLVIGKGSSNSEFKIPERSAESGGLEEEEDHACKLVGLKAKSGARRKMRNGDIRSIGRVNVGKTTGHD